MDFTPEQQSAIKMRGTNILVSAGAGSGKTGVLTERIIDRLRDGEDIDRLLVLTYTKAATTEMLNRIRDKIFVALRNANTKEEQAHWHKQVILLGDAPITTMHSFCMQLIRRHYNAFDGLDPEFKIVEPGIARVHLLDLLNTYMTSCYAMEDMEKRQHFFSLVRHYGSRLSDDGLKQEIIALREFGYAQGNLYEWLDEMLHRFCDLDGWHTTALALTKGEAAIVLECLKNMVKTISAWGGPAKYSDSVTSEIAVLENLLKGWTWEKVQETSVFQSIGRKTKDDDPVLAEIIRKQHENVKKYYQERVEVFFQRDFKDYARDITLVAEEMETLVALTKEFSQIYQDYKIKNGFMEFSDLEQFAYDLLRSHPELVEEYREGFHEVLIDEYQDVNPLQEKILNLLSNGKNLFVVGDIKQSIYGFRFADHSIFKARYDSYGLREPNENGVNILLNRNFRSRSGILDTVNFFFRQWMNPRVSGIPYGEEEELIVGNESAQKSEEHEINTEVQFIYEPDAEEKSEFYDDADSITLHGRFIAKRIEEMIENEETITENGRERKITYGDIAILMRSVKNESDVIEEELTYRAIPVIGPHKRRFTEGQEVRLLRSLLSVVDNPCQDIPLAALMRSPFFGFDENEMMEIALESKKKRLWERMESYLSKEGETSLKEKTRRFQEIIIGWRQYSRMYSLCDLIHKVMEDTHFEAFWSGLPGGKNRLRNLKVFMEKAEYFQESGGNLFDFLRYIQNLEDAEADTIDDSWEEKNTVHISTIHKSKGLEYPIVFCVAMNKRFNRREYSSPLLLDSKLGFGPRYKNQKRHSISSTLPRLLIRHKKEQADTAELLRVLYVAMTRAKNQLIFTATIKKKEDIAAIKNRTTFVMDPLLPAEIMDSGYSFMHWICFGLARKENVDVGLLHRDAKIKVAFLPGENPLEVKKVSATVSVLSEDSLSNLKKALSLKDVPAIPGKVSVTELLPDDGIEYGFSLPKPQFLSESPQLTPAEKGTAFHRFMEHLDYGKSWDMPALERYREEMMHSGSLTQKEAQSVDMEAVLFFLKSSYGKDLMTAREIRSEMTFTAVLSAKELLGVETDEKTVLQGAIDMLYAKENGEWVLMDFKTNRLGSGGEDSFLKHYSKQLDLYAQALAHLYNIEVKEKIFYLAKEKRFLTHI